MGAARHVRPNRTQAGIAETLQAHLAGVVTNDGVVAHQLKEFASGLGRGLELCFVGEFFQEIGLLLSREIEKKLSEFRLASRVDPIDAADELYLRIVTLTDRIGRGPYLPARAHGHAVRHHEVNELGDTGFLGPRTVIRGDNHLGHVLDESVLLRGKEKQLV